MIENITAYTILKKEVIEDLNSTGYLLKHTKSGARVLLLQNDDKNKVFNIGFRTPPTDDTGVAHIVEHSVLCGSKKFPVKDPFSELVKGSLNTFLNAMTYPDKTIYPVASCNDKDFKNLVSIYMDAVFYPSIYNKEEIFRQEGWTYELETAEDKLSYNGVVYNEMKGALATPESVLNVEQSRRFFPDNCYSYVSGGDPEAIPSLTYEDFLNFHKKYYHPSNSYIYLYGDMDMESYLNWMDEEYLSQFDVMEIDSEIVMQKPFDEAKYDTAYYSLGDEEEEQEKYIYSYTVTAGIATDCQLYYAMKVLDYALISMPGAPLQKALVDAGIGKNISGGFDTASLQHQFEIIAKEAKADKREEFVSIIEHTLKKVVEEGIDKDSLKAALNVIEFQYREADFGSYPKGLFYCLYSFESWLYDENEPFMYIQAGKIFETLNQLVNSRYYEELVETYLLNNTHKLVLTLEPKKKLTEELDKKIDEKLQTYKASLSEEELNALVEYTKALKAYKDTPSSKEELEKIPVLKLEDIDKLPREFNIEERQLQGVKIIFSKLHTNGIAYINAAFDTKKIQTKYLPYLSLLKEMLAIVDTEKYPYVKLNNVINMNSGGFYNALAMYGKADGGSEMLFANEIKVFYDKIAFAFEMIEEVILHTKFSDLTRLKEIISEKRSQAHTRLMSGAYMTAITRASSYVTESSKIKELTSGVDYYQFLSDLESNFEEKKEELQAILEELCRQLFTKDNLIISLTCDEEGYEKFEKQFSILLKNLPEKSDGKIREVLSVEKKNEAFKIPSLVSYDARVGNFKQAGFDYTGALQTLGNILDNDYLYKEIRVKGGAYGVMGSYSATTGMIGFVSYRDPNVLRTYEIYETIPQYLRNFDADDREILKYIIGTISFKDRPLNPAAQGKRSFAAYISGITYEDICKEREEILSLSVEKVRALAPILEAILSQGYLCTVGNQEKIMECADKFGEIKDLF